MASFATSDGIESEPTTSSSVPATSSSVQGPHPFRLIELSEIHKATANFDESLVIGKGGFGKVYKGNMINGESLLAVAIKRLASESRQGAAEFEAEVKMLSTLRHRNIVSLIGCCIHEQEKILVYEYMSKGSLSDHLHKRGTSLSWLRRLNICLDAGRGLSYLHNNVAVDYGVIHRDFKSENILLHESWTAKVSDFGLSKACPTNQLSDYVNASCKGTFGYMDPSFFYSGKLTRKSDVFAFGVLLLEVLCRRRAVSKNLGEQEPQGLVAWFQTKKEENLDHIVDSEIRSEIHRKCLEQFIRLAENCLHDKPEERPNMDMVVTTLELLIFSQEKANTQAAGKTIFSRFVDRLPFPSKGEKSEMIEVRAHFQSPNPTLKEVKFADLKKATKNFSMDMRIPPTYVGRVFLAWVEQNTLAPSKERDGIAVAVKRHIPFDKWLAEKNILGQLAHPNIIKLLGYSNNENENLLVYEYMPNKSFLEFFFTETLSWEIRLLIMIGVARALAYLHSKNIIHRGLEHSHILLDEDLSAKLGGFGLATYGPETHVLTEVEGRRGYMDPNYQSNGQLTTKSDIYGFGVMLLESIAGRSVHFLHENQTLVDWATGIHTNKRNVKEIIDPRLEDNYSLQSGSECFSLAVRCVSNNPADRPSSEEVLQNLEQIHALYK
ncbi:putative protein kinase RLK-Pelle-CrRLK1L-1 family [Helianthus annuus]|nr:putative protein kinase RLK-Pelle-CrRLK1L-1 family [Helianthus annuus]